jgi:hypothetical protein
MSSSDTPDRATLAPGFDSSAVDPTPDSDRDHGTDGDVTEFEGLSATEARNRLRALSLPERIEVLFGVEPFDYQRDVGAYVDQNSPARVAIQPGRQVGKTLWGAALAADDAIIRHGEDTLIAAPFQETADELMREATRLLETAEKRVAAIEGLSIGVETRNKREWEFAHGGRLLSRTLGVDGVGQRGKSPKFVIVDESAFVPDDVFESVVEAFFATHNDYTFTLLSTPSGDSGFFYRKVKLDDDWYSPYWPTAICPLVDTDWLAERKRKNDARTFQREYLGEFVSSSDRFFDAEAIDDAMSAVSLDDRDLSIGADIARAGDDQTAIVAVDELGTAEVLVADRNMTLTEAAGTLVDLYESRDVDAIAIDETGLGAGPVEMVESELGEAVVEGVKFSIERKQSLYNELKNDLENGTLDLANDGQLLRELRELEYSLTARGKTKIDHPDGGHDDLADALALAAWVNRGGASDDYARDSDNVVVL